jgi:hypothetical protein
MLLAYSPEHRQIKTVEIAPFGGIFIFVVIDVLLP